MDILSADADLRRSPADGAAGAAATVVVYTAITAGDDDLRHPPPGARERARFVAHSASTECQSRCAIAL